MKNILSLVLVFGYLIREGVSSFSGDNAGAEYWFAKRVQEQSKRAH